MVDPAPAHWASTPPAPGRTVHVPLPLVAAPAQHEPPKAAESDALVAIRAVLAARETERSNVVGYRDNAVDAQASYERQASEMAQRAAENNVLLNAIDRNIADLRDAVRTLGGSL